MLDGVVARSFRLDERKTARVGRHAADDEIHPVGQAEALPANLDERAAGHERAQAALERGPLLARNAKRPHQFLGGRGVIDPIADQSKNLLF